MVEHIEDPVEAPVAMAKQLLTRLADYTAMLEEVLSFAIQSFIHLFIHLVHLI